MAYECRQSDQVSIVVPHHETKNSFSAFTMTVVGKKAAATVSWPP